MLGVQKREQSSSSSSVIMGKKLDELEVTLELVKSMFGIEQLTAMADFVQGSLMLRYNQRIVG